MSASKTESCGAKNVRKCQCCPPFALQNFGGKSNFEFVRTTSTTRRGSSVQVFRKSVERLCANMDNSSALAQRAIDPAHRVAEEVRCEFNACNPQQIIFCRF